MMNHVIKNSSSPSVEKADVDMHPTRGSQRKQVGRPRSSAAQAALPARPAKKSVACCRCHEQKIRCSGDTPCSRCHAAGYGDQCRYVSRDRKIRVSESYLEQLLSDSKELRSLRTNSHGDNATDDKGQDLSLGPSSQHLQPNCAENLFSKKTISMAYEDSALPIYICETACSAFATRVCQSLNGIDGSTFPLQWNFVDESTLSSLLEVDTAWPSFAQAQLLLKTAIGQANPAFHLTLKLDTLELLNDVYRKARFNEPAIKCKYFALFALGQVYSAMPDSTAATVPGTTYFARALSLIQIPPERPNMMHIETILCLALFSQFLNRFHSAYLLIGNALRLALSLRLNYNPTETCPNAVDREHRIRLWWSIYAMDKFWGIKSGLPSLVSEQDMHVDLPKALISPVHAEQFNDHGFQIAAISIARLIGSTVQEIYRAKRGDDGSFLQREQNILIQSRQCVESLPESLKLQSYGPNPRNVITMHLQLNYCVMIAMRPVLLHILSRRATASYDSIKATSSTAVAICETSFYAAKHSISLCLEAWTNGPYSMLSYDFPFFLFSSALVLLIANYLKYEETEDVSLVETAREMLQTLKRSGNFSARDLSDHLEFVINCFQGAKSEPSQTLGPVATVESPPSPALDSGKSTYTPSDISPPSLGTEFGAVDGVSIAMSAQTMTMQMAFNQAGIQNFLDQSDFSLGPEDPLHFLDDSMSSFWWEKPLYTE